MYIFLDKLLSVHLCVHLHIARDVLEPPVNIHSPTHTHRLIRFYRVIIEEFRTNKQSDTYSNHSIFYYCFPAPNYHSNDFFRRFTGHCLWYKRLNTLI